MKIYVFGNPAVDSDSLPIRMLPEIKKRLPGVEFVLHDPVEELEELLGPVELVELVVLDTVVGIDRVRVFDGLEPFIDSPRYGAHDFDLLSDLKLMQKLKKIGKIKIIGVPPMISENDAIDQIEQEIASLRSQ